MTSAGARCLYEGQLDGKVHPYVTALSVGLGYSTFGVKVCPTSHSQHGH